MTTQTYRGRFAPSPTGPLHLGSLIAAVGSYLRARSLGGSWLVRIDDLDPPREMPGAAEGILETLEAFALAWDEPVVYQSQRHDAYQAALEQLRERGYAYPCGCTRKEVLAVAERGPMGAIYPGTCRHGLPAGREPRSWRVDSRAQQVRFDDVLQGEVAVDIETAIGDPIVRRADGLYAYHLAVVVDDAAAGITEVVRGSDLLASTPPQIMLQRMLGLPTPEYLHLPVAINAAMKKLSKQTKAPPLDAANPGPALTLALEFLGHPPPAELCDAPPGEQLEWARRNWRHGQLPRTAEIPAPDL